MIEPKKNRGIAPPGPAHRRLVGAAFATLLLLCVAAVMILPGCAGQQSLVTPGTQPIGGGLVIDAGMEWTRIRGSRHQTWTIDGELLNRLYLIPAVRPGEHVLLQNRQSRWRPDGAFYQRGMRLDEQMNVILDGIRTAGAVGVVGDKLAPTRFGNRQGLRFGFELASPQGLHYRGLGAAFEHERGLAIALFLAPAEYYFPRDSVEVDRMLGTLRLQ